MDAASRLFCLRQGNRCIEDYVVDFFQTAALKDIFCHGLNEPIHSCLPGGKIHWSLEQYIDYALRLSGSSFTVGIADEGPRNPAVTPTPQPVHVKPAKPAQVMSGIIQVTSEPYHAMSAKPKPTQVTSNTPKPVHVMPAKSKPVQATSTKPRSANVTSAKLHSTSAKPQPALIMPAAPGPARAMPARPESAPVMAALLQPAHKMAALPEPAHKMAALPEPVHKMAALPEPGH
ncbi:Foot protein 1 variant 1 [Labeo rohita]|uniref:Foot protein 1 variant 1 n=1 Tax=Labeo rohita TaxID=84645 RepID=A0ABQ8L9N6_LABRO|nr:Foot protein 1 variant 1 [Labeo rohita]